MCAILVGVLLLQAAHWFHSSAAPTQPDSPEPGLVGAISAIPSAANPLVAGSIASPGFLPPHQPTDRDPSRPAFCHALTKDAVGSRRGSGSGEERWPRDRRFIRSGGHSRFDSDCARVSTAASLDTSWSGLIQEPPRIGTDDRGVAYRDDNYIRFCGPGVATVVLYYWAASKSNVKTMSGTFKEPVNLGAGKYASTYWKLRIPAATAAA